MLGLAKIDFGVYNADDFKTTVPVAVAALRSFDGPLTAAACGDKLPEIYDGVDSLYTMYTQLAGSHVRHMVCRADDDIKNDALEAAAAALIDFIQTDAAEDLYTALQEKDVRAFLEKHGAGKREPLQPLAVVRRVWSAQDTRL